MKKRLIYLFVVLISVISYGCKDYDDTEVWDSINSLEQRMSAMETVMNAYKNNILIKSVDETNNGYVITFTDGSSATIANGKDGQDGVDGKDGDTLIESITINENNVTFNLTDGRSFSIPLYSSLTVDFDSDDLLAMSPNSERDVHYIVHSLIKDIKVEVLSSEDIKAKVVPDSETDSTGAIHIITGSAIDEYSKVVVLVTNGEKMIMKSIYFEEAGLEVADGSKIVVEKSGANVQLKFLTNLDCEAVIPDTVKSWISEIPKTKSLEKQSIDLKIEPDNSYNRSAIIIVRSKDQTLSVEYTIEQRGELGEYIKNPVPSNEIWYVTSNNRVADLDDRDPFDAEVVSNTYTNGKGVIKFNGPVTRIGFYAFQCNSNITELYLPDNIETIENTAIYNLGITTLRIPANLKKVEYHGICSQKLENFTGAHVSSDGRCVIVGKELVAFAPVGLKEYTLPEGAEIIIDDVFENNNNLESVVISEGYKEIWNSFPNCINLKKVTLPSSLEYVSEDTFKGCVSLEGFYGNNNFHTDDNRCLIEIRNDKKTVIDFARAGLTEYTFPEGISIISKISSDELRSVTIPSSVTSASSYAFSNCPNLEFVYGPNISEDHRCLVVDKKLIALIAQKNVPTDYSLPKGITKIGQWPIYNKEIEKISMGDEVTEIEYGAFLFCDNLKTITLSAGLKKIGSPAKFRV